ncbi:unnamed protein product, partial [Mesorhabditis belari]|uniref:Copper homeostasis protein cutC homolog n=1 Tax=Mesorhabditis belari TaxID=2138241 RepID=A0AAF3FFJ9_9BILA
MPNYKLEVCIDSFDSAIAAVEGGATQLEVCSALPLGGLTPSIGLVKKIYDKFPITKMMIMIRCRGGDFVYEENEMLTMLEDVANLKPYASGFVFGCLNSDDTLNLVNCGRLLGVAAPLPCTLHRAFDLTADWKTSLDEAIQLGFTSILTSGQCSLAIQGIALLTEIVVYSGTRIEIIVGSGVSEATLQSLITATNARAYHGSGSIIVPSRASEPTFFHGIYGFSGSKSYV